MNGLQYQELRVRMPELKLPPYDWLPEEIQARLWDMSKEQVVASRLTAKLQGDGWPWSRGRLQGHRWIVSIQL